MFLLIRHNHAQGLLHARQEPLHLIHHPDDDAQDRQHPRDRQHPVYRVPLARHLLHYFIRHGDGVRFTDVRRIMHLLADIFRVPLLNTHRVALLLDADAVVQPYRVP